MTFDHLYLCYTPQNYFKALFLAHEKYERGESVRILALFLQGREDLAFFRTEKVYWAEIELRLHKNKYIRILPADLSNPLSYLRKASRKIAGRLARTFRRRAELRALVDSVMDSGTLYLFLESTYFSSHLLKHRKCTLIEEGLSAYKPYFSRIGRAARARYPGEHPSVSEVWLRYPERANKRVLPKVKPLVLDYERLPGQARNILLKLFGLSDFVREPRSAIVVGQAWSQSVVGSQPMLVHYKKVVDWLSAQGYSVFVKPHPSEDPGPYQEMGGTLLNAKMPLELFALGTEPYAFDVALSFLESSLVGASHLAEVYECYLTGDAVVEEISLEQFGELSATLDAWLARLPTDRDYTLIPRPASPAQESHEAPERVLVQGEHEGQ